MANRFTIQTVFSAVDHMTTTMQQIGVRAGALGQRVGNVVGGIGRGFKVVGAGVAAFGAVAGAAAFGVYKLAEGVSNLGDNVAKTARSIGLTTDALQEFRYIGERSGVSVDEMDVALKKLTINLGDASSEVAGSLGRLGLSVSQLKAAGPDEVLNLIADGMQNVADPTERAAIAVDLFGRGGVKMANVLAEGRSGLANLASEAHRVGYVLGQETLDASELLNDSILNMQTSFKAIGNTMAAQFLPVVNDAVNGLTEFAIANRSAFSGLAEGLVNVFRELGPIISRILPPLTKLINLVAKLLTTALAKLTPIMDKVFSSFERMLPAVEDLFGTLGELLGPVLDVASALLDIALPVFEVFIKVIAWLAKVLSAVLVPVLGFVKNSLIGLRQVGEAIVAFFVGIPGAIIAAWTAVGQFFTDLWNGIVQAFQAAVSFLMPILQPVLDAIKVVQNGLASIGLGGPPPAPAGVSLGASSSTYSEHRSVVDVNFGGAPAGTTIRQTGAAPGVRLNTGSARTR